MDCLLFKISFNFLGYILYIIFLKSIKIDYLY